MVSDPASIALIGFGEAASAFVEGAPQARNRVRAFDIKTLDPSTRAAKIADYGAAGIAGVETLSQALTGATLALSLVTADRSLEAAESALAGLAPNTLFCDMNSVAPATKRRAAEMIERAGGRYADVAVMSPVRPLLTASPLLIAGAHATAAQAQLLAFGFTDVRCVDGPVGAASAIKMIRSVMIKGMEALTAECLIAAEAAGVQREILATLDASWSGADWNTRADYNLDRMLVHGVRRAAEMEEVVQTLDDLGVPSRMAAAASRWQRALGGVANPPPLGLSEKLATILESKALRA